MIIKNIRKKIANSRKPTAENRHKIITGSKNILNSTASHIQAFRERDFLSDICRMACLPFVFLDRKKYKDQLLPGMRNIEVMLEGCIKMIPHFPKVWKLASLPLDFITNYTSVQRKVAKRKQYNVYSKKDEEVVFRPEYDIIYVYMIAQIPYIISRIAPALDDKIVSKINKSIRHMTALAADTYNMFPTYLPAFGSEDRITHKIILSVDGQSNACPSLHVAYSYFIANLCAHLNLPELDEIAWESIEQTAKDMTYAVQYTKRHAYIDVSGGELLAEIVFKEHFGSLPLQLNDFYSDPIFLGLLK